MAEIMFGGVRGDARFSEMYQWNKVIRQLLLKTTILSYHGCLKLFLFKI